MGASTVVETYMIFILAFLGLAAFGVRTFYRTDHGKYMIDRYLLRVPVLGDVLRKVAARVHAHSGHPIDKRRAHTRRAGHHIPDRRQRRSRGGGPAAAPSDRGGKTLSEPMKQSGFFPPMVIQMVSVGESTGELDNMLVKVADYYEEEVDTVVANLLTIMEPVIMVVLGVIVGTIVIAMYMPLFKLIRVLSGG